MEIKQHPAFQSFVQILARGGVKKMLELGIISHLRELTPEKFRQVVQVAKDSGQNALAFQDEVKGEMSEFVNSQPGEVVQQLIQLFTSGAQCQRGLVFVAMQEMAKQEELVSAA